MRELIALSRDSSELGFGYAFSPFRYVLVELMLW